MRSLFNFLLMAAVAFALTSCGGDDTPPGPKPVAADSVTLDHRMLSLIAGEDSLLVATVWPATATGKTVTWATSDSTVAKVAGGNITALKAGPATITASAGGKSAQCVVSVSAVAVPVDSVTLSRKTLTIAVGDDSTLVAAVWPGNATDAGITWSSSDSLTAKVDQTGKVTALKPGPATITATAGGKSAQCTVTVEPMPIAKGATGPLVWKLYEDGLLMITGEGEMPDYNYPDYAPWFPRREQVTELEIGSGVTRIGDWAFYGSTILAEVDVPDGVESIGQGAFYGCTAMTGITLPEGLPDIGYRTFFNCESLTEISIPNSVTSIGSYAFYDCEDLAGVDLPDDLAEIEEYTFAGCTSLTAITIPAGVTGIGENAFGDCPALNSVTSLSTSPPTPGAGNFDAATDILYVPGEYMWEYADWIDLFVDVQAIP